MRKGVLLCLYLLLLLALPQNAVASELDEPAPLLEMQFATEDDDEEDEEPQMDGGAASSHQSIPEPLVFDLIRPLDAKRGEWEINSLFLKPLHNGSYLDWAPEIEYAFADGHGIELELPMQNGQVEAVKLALQGRIGTAFHESVIHGWQYIGRYNRHDRSFTNDALYIAGIRFNERWSTLSMIGARRTDIRNKGRNLALCNLSLFYDTTPRIITGVEVNLQLGHNQDQLILVMPQIHFNLSDHWTLQAGMGAQKHGSESFGAVASWRIIRAF